MKLDPYENVLYIETAKKSSQKKMPNGHKHAWISYATDTAQLSQLWHLQWKHQEEDAICLSGGACQGKAGKLGRKWG